MEANAKNCPKTPIYYDSKLRLEANVATSLLTGDRALPQPRLVAVFYAHPSPLRLLLTTCFKALRFSLDEV